MFRRLDRDLRQGDPIRLIVDGKIVQAFRGETVAAALLASGLRAFRTTARAHAPRAAFCGMGVCFECLVTINGVSGVRSCMAPVEEGMTVVTGGEL